tara:strand:+ start:3089 stop:3952 length:864 start_codon:yes stop_codon:yes gene_type:complete
MSSRNFNRVNTFLSNSPDYGAKINADQLEEDKKANIKLDTLGTKLDSLFNQQDGVLGAINNTTIGDAQLGHRSFVYAHDVTNGKARALKCDTSGRLECSVDALEITADTINLSTDELEAKIQATNDKLDSFAGAGNNNIGEGASKLQVFNYGKDSDAGNFKPIKIDGTGQQHVVLSNDFPSGSVLSNVVLSTGAVNTTTLDLGASHNYRKVFFFGKCAMGNASDNFTINVSNDNTNYFRVSIIRPTLNPIDSAFHFGHKMMTPRYIRFGNECGTNLTAFTINFVKLK